MDTLQTQLNNYLEFCQFQKKAGFQNTQSIPDRSEAIHTANSV